MALRCGISETNRPQGDAPKVKTQPIQREEDENIVDVAKENAMECIKGLVIIDVLLKYSTLQRSVGSYNKRPQYHKRVPSTKRANWRINGQRLRRHNKTSRRGHRDAKLVISRSTLPVNIQINVLCVCTVVFKLIIRLLLGNRKQGRSKTPSQPRF